MLAPEIFVGINAGMPEQSRNRSECLLGFVVLFFFFFEESIVLEFQKAQLGTKCHLLLATETQNQGKPSARGS